MATDSSSKDLLSFVGSVAGESRLRVEQDLGNGYVVLRVSEAERRQAQHDIQHVEDIVIELLRNARDAGAQNIYVALHKEGSIRTIVVIDDGSGIPEGLRERIFDARVTSKLDNYHLDRWGVHGRGMALFSIKQNSQDAHVAASADGLGSSFVVCTDTIKVPERKDQSSWPQASVDEEGTIELVKGPHNIVRSCVEFAIEEKDSCRVFLGSVAEIIASMVHENPIDFASLTHIFSEIEELPLCARLSLAASASELVELAQGLGLNISERNAQRVLSGQIGPLKDVLAQIFKKTDALPKKAKKDYDLFRDRRGLRIAKSDMAEFKERLTKDFEILCERYYLEPQSEPVVSVRNNRLVVSFGFEKTD